MTGDSVFLLHALFMGVFITFVYDGLIILRKVVPHKALVESLEDLLFWIFCAVYVFVWMYRESNGTLRWFAIAGALAGMIIYKKTISGLLIKGAVWLLSHILHMLSKVFTFVWTPFRLLGRKWKMTWGMLSHRRRKMQGNLKIWLKSYLKALKIRLSKR